MSHISRIGLALKSLRELGFRQVSFYASYWLGLKTGYYKRITKAGGVKTKTDKLYLQLHPVIDLPDKPKLVSLLGDEGLKAIFEEANEILAGKVRLFGGLPVPLQLEPQEPLSHWSTYITGKVSGDYEDIKFVWEPGRFGWAFTLARAYYLSDNEVYAETFWDLTETFLETNPPNMGPQWVSGQEVALRIIALTFAWHIFRVSPSSTTERASRLASALIEHVLRIPPTLTYARAQNNNHLLSEAAGLYTAGLILCGCPGSQEWRTTGWYRFNQALQTQIADDGTYVQHSTNYHRLMLQLALWVDTVANFQGEDFPPDTRHRLADATRWLSELCDPETGVVPNLGPNDGANILPLSTCSIYDYRPVIQTAHLAFCGESLYGSGLWNELCLWMREGEPMPERVSPNLNDNGKTKHILRLSNSWAYLRTAEFFSRPGHADQLHLDLWWRGQNVALDPGSFSYNAPAPWNNALTRTAVHNTVTVNDLDQMTYVGRFLWLDWAQGKLISHEQAEDGSWENIVVQHNGYRKLKIVHRREVLARKKDSWTIKDRIMSVGDSEQEFRNQTLNVGNGYTKLSNYSIALHWLLPDWDWEIEENNKRVAIFIVSPYGPIALSVGTDEKIAQHQTIPGFVTQVIRAGEMVYGSGVPSPTHGWMSPTYGFKSPALSLSIKVEATLPYIFISEWRFPN